MEKIIGHVPQSFAKILQPLMKNGVVIRLNGKIVVTHIRAPEGTWTQGGGIQIPQHPNGIHKVHLSTLAPIGA